MIIIQKTANLTLVAKNVLNVSNMRKKNLSEEFDDDNICFYHSPLSLKCPLKTKNFCRHIINQ